MIAFVALLLVAWVFPSTGYAACSGSSPTLTAADTSQVEVQACITAAANGDTIIVPPGSANWSGVSFTNKDITLQGSGIGSTNITLTAAGALSITMTGVDTVHSWRVTGFTFITDQAGAISVSSATTAGYTKGWRVDHVRLNTTAFVAWPFQIHGITWGLIDHFTADGTPSAIIYIEGFINNSLVEDTDCAPHCLGYYYWNRALNLGTDEAVYIEDSLFDADGTGGAIAINDLDLGGSLVLRHNTFNGQFFQTHSTRFDHYGGMKLEVYNNTFNGLGYSRPTQVRSGTGVIFNNTVSGYASNTFDIDGQREATTCEFTAAPLGTCDGANARDGNIDANGWPCVGAVGRGPVSGWDETASTQTNTPLYAWKNGSTATCSIGGVCNNSVNLTLNACGAALATYLKTPASPHSNGQYDYVNNGDTPKPGYTPYTYPHPLQGVVAGSGAGLRGSKGLGLY